MCEVEGVDLYWTFISHRVCRCWCGGGGGPEGAKIFIVCLGAFKNRPGQGEGVKIGYRTKGLITWVGLARFAEILAP